MDKFEAPPPRVCPASLVGGEERGKSGAVWMRRDDGDKSVCFSAFSPLSLIATRPRLPYPPPTDEGQQWQGVWSSCCSSTVRNLLKCSTTLWLLLLTLDELIRVLPHNSRRDTGESCCVCGNSVHVQVAQTETETLKLDDKTAYI